ncbi:MAG: hypothetical protein A3E83_01940 [Gammaproteobacteria bacterium RIFCSPHIGHO2_12_FULL_41_20]|nr:MAG: hypothetical protein A3E83_01940 [Gammaproteobacteria bacterium RIFCSPHIGHO2_12_FULL_41_20]
MAVKDVKFRTAKPRDKDYKIPAERGLYMLVKTNGAKCWRFKYRFLGKEKLLSIGIYPDIGLGEAIEARDKARKLLANKVDPGLNKQIEKRSAKLAAENSFEAIDPAPFF